MRTSCTYPCECCKANGGLSADKAGGAGDFVICCRGSAQEAMRAMRSIMRALKLTVNEQKTSICTLPEGRFGFLGYTIGRCYSPKTGKAYIGTRPSKKAIRHICRAISEATARRWLLKDHQERTTHLNRMLAGWGNYFRLGPVSRTYRSVDSHTRKRLRWWLCDKYRIPGMGTSRFPAEVLYNTLGQTKGAETDRPLLNVPSITIQPQSCPNPK